MATTQARHTGNSADRISACVEAARELDKIRKGQIEPVPSDWFTISDYEAAVGCRRSKAHSDLKELARLGKLDSKVWPALDRRGRIYHLVIYRKK